MFKFPIQIECEKRFGEWVDVFPKGVKYTIAVFSNEVIYARRTAMHYGNYQTFDEAKEKILKHKEFIKKKLYKVCVGLEIPHGMVVYDGIEIIDEVREDD